MLTRGRMLHAVLLILGLLAPILFVVGILQRGLALLDTDFVRLGVTYLLLALGAGATAYLAFQPRGAALRLVAALGLLLNLGTIVLVSSLWAHHMRQTIGEIEMRPVEAGKVGILVAAASNSPDSTAEARAIEDSLRYFVEKTGLAPYVSVHHVYPLHSVERARDLAARLRAHIVVWKTEKGRDPVECTFHVTVLGANETDVLMVPEDLLQVMALQDDLTFVHQRGLDQNDSIGPKVVAPVAAGFGCLTVGRPMIAAAQFKTVLDGGLVPTETLPLLRNHYAGALLALGRGDLALEEYKLANGLRPNARSYVGIGNAMAALHDWEASYRAYARAVALDPYEPMGYCGLGVTQARHHNVEQALSSFQQAVDLAPKQSVPYALVAYAYELQGRAEAAREAYRDCALHAGPNVALQTAALDRADQMLRRPPTAVPTATQIPIPTVTPIPASRIYVVKSGDTLQAIADELGVTMDELVELNDLPNPDSIAIGQELLIPKDRD